MTRSPVSALLALAFLVCPTGLLARAVESDRPCEAPSEISFDSSAGRVEFPHDLHTEIGVSCQDCHHETLAADLQMPHPEYFEDFWIQCKTCHHPDSSPDCPQPCGVCHHGSPTTVADETLSSKVVLHEACWECHPAATGAAASRSCGTCHDQPPRSEIQ